MALVRPWLGGVAALIIALAWLVGLAWSVDWQPAGIYDGLGGAAEAVRLDGLAIAAGLQAAEELRVQVRGLRDAGVGREQLTAARSALANQLRAAYLVATRDGQHELALGYLADAVKAAPERLDLQCLLIRARAQAGDDLDERMSLLKLAYRTDAACAHWMLGEIFLAEGRTDTALTFLQRAVARRPDLGPAHLLLSRIYLQAGDRKTALDRATLAWQHARGLQERLAAAEQVRASGGGAPPREQIIAEDLLRQYGWAALSGLALLLFLVHPAIVGAIRRRRGRQRSSADSAS